MEKLTQKEIETLQDMCLDDSTKIIRYLEEEKQRQRLHNLFLLVVTVVGAVGSIIAAITGVILLFQYGG